MHKLLEFLPPDKAPEEDKNKANMVRHQGHGKRTRRGERVRHMTRKNSCYLIVAHQYMQNGM